MGFWQDLSSALLVLRGKYVYHVDGENLMQTVVTRLDSELAAAVAWGHEQFPDAQQFSRIVALKGTVQKLEMALDSPSGSIEAEIADALMLVASIAEASNVKLARAVHRKMEKNHAKYVKKAVRA